MRRIDGSSGVSFRRFADVARSAGRRRVQDRPSSCEDADAADGDRGALSPPAYKKREPGHKIYPYLLRGIEITRANQVRAMAPSPTSRWRAVLSTWRWCSTGSAARVLSSRLLRSRYGSGVLRRDAGGTVARTASQRSSTQTWAQRFRPIYAFAGALASNGIAMTWMAGALGATTCSSSDCGAAWERGEIRARLRQRACPRRPRITAHCVKTFITSNIHTRALTVIHPIETFSNPLPLRHGGLTQQGFTYQRGNPV